MDCAKIHSFFFIIYSRYSSKINVNKTKDEEKKNRNDIWILYHRNGNSTSSASFWLLIQSNNKIFLLQQVRSQNHRKNDLFELKIKKWARPGTDQAGPVEIGNKKSPFWAKSKRYSFFFLLRYFFRALVLFIYRIEMI